MTSVRTRFAPSPTGDLHLGGVRTALFNWLLARRFGGAFLLRIDDTDRERSTAAAEASILEGLTWLGLQWDQEPERQSARVELHRAAAEQLVASGAAYRSDGAIRFAMPKDGETVVDDACRGRVTFSNATLDDLVIIKSDGTPTYNFATVVDDALMGITHIVRGDDLLNATPRQIQIYRALGHTPPAFAHLPLVLGRDRQRLSKRHGAEAILTYRDRGFLPEAILNAAARLGWSGGGGRDQAASGSDAAGQDRRKGMAGGPDAARPALRAGTGQREVFTMAEVVGDFSLDRLTKAASVFDPDKLAWLNQSHMARLSDDELARRVAAFAGLDLDATRLARLAGMNRRSSKTLADLAGFLRPLVGQVTVDPALVAAHAAPLAGAVRSLSARWAALPAWDAAALDAAGRALAGELGLKLGPLAQALRVLLTGATVSAGVFEVAAELGRDESLARLRAVD